MNDKSENHLDLERPQQRTFLSNYRPITCLHMILKILTTKIEEEIYYCLLYCILFSKEKKGFLRGKTRKREPRSAHPHGNQN